MEQMPAEILVKKEIDESYHQNDFNGRKENEINHEEVAGFNQEQIEKEPIHIKDEPFQSDDDERNTNDTTCSNNNVNSEPKLSKQDKIVKIIANKCYICNRVLDSKDEFMEHLESHKSMLPYECLPCSTKTKPIKAYSMAALNKHFQRHGFYYLCPHCPLRYQTSSTLHLHIRNTHKERKTEYQCETCKKVFTDRNVYRTHINGHRDLAMERYKCEPCGKAFAWKRSFEEHKKSHICARNTEKQAQQKKIANELKSGKDVIIEAKEQKITPTKNDYEILQQKKISVSSNQSSVVKKEQNDSEGSNIANGYHNDDISRNTHEQIELAPIDIKDEPKSDDEEMDDNTSTYSNDSESYESNPTVRPTEGKIKSKAVETILNKCFICNTLLENEIEFDDHLESHRNMLPFKCPQCSTEAKPVRAATVAALNKHFERHGFEFACSQCPLRFRDSKKLANHRRKNHKEDAIECETCGKVLSNIQGYRNHVTAHKNLDEQRYKCEPCQKVFGLKLGLLTHKRSYLCIRNTEIHSRRKNTTKEVSTEINSMKPMVQIPLGDSDDGGKATDETADKSSISSAQKTIETKCYICDTILKTKSELNDHLGSHKEMLPYKCAQCSTETYPIIFTTVVLLNKHFESHGFEFVCPQCPRRYRTSHAFSNHIWNVHEHKTEHTCKTCGKSFVTNNGLRRHVITHNSLEVKRYKCETCQKHFLTENNLLRHQAHH